MVAATAALMLEQDPTLSPDTIKARLMLSARKIPGSPFERGAGVLDITGALEAVGQTDYAASPFVVRGPEPGTIVAQETGVLWGDPMWSSTALWSDSAIWGDTALWSAETLTCDAIPEGD